MARFKSLDSSTSLRATLYLSMYTYTYVRTRILVRISLKERVYTFLKRGTRIYIYTRGVYTRTHTHTDTTDTRLSDPPSYEYIHLCYPDKAKEAVCALNIDFKRKPCYKTAVKKVRIRQTSNFLPPLPPSFPHSNGKLEARRHDGLIWRRIRDVYRLGSATSSFVDNGVVTSTRDVRRASFFFPFFLPPSLSLSPTTVDF